MKGYEGHDTLFLCTLRSLYNAITIDPVLKLS